MRLCQCGGQVSAQDLTNNRERWTCKACGRCETLESNRPDFGTTPKKQNDADSQQTIFKAEP